MFRKKQTFYHSQAQIVLEYTIVLGIVSLVIFSMAAMIKRYTQGTIKIVADHLGNQVNGEQRFEKERGYMMATYTTIHSDMETNIVERAGERKKYSNDTSTTSTNTFSDLGFQSTDPYGTQN